MTPESCECRSRPPTNGWQTSAGVDTNTIRAWGHVSIDTTNIYAETDLEMKAKALATCEVKETKRSRQMEGGQRANDVPARAIVASTYVAPTLLQRFIRKQLGTGRHITRNDT